MALETLTPDSTIDLSGLRCPHLLITIISKLKNLGPGHLLQITANDINAPSSIAAWSRQSGNPLLDMYQEGDSFIFLLQCQRAADCHDLNGPSDHH